MTPLATYFPAPHYWWASDSFSDTGGDPFRVADHCSSRSTGRKVAARLRRFERDALVATMTSDSLSGPWFCRGARPSCKEERQRLSYPLMPEIELAKGGGAFRRWPNTSGSPSDSYTT